MATDDEKTIPDKVEGAVGESAEIISKTLSDWLAPLEGTPFLYIGVVSVSLLSLVISVPTAVTLLPIPILLSNLWQSLSSGQVLRTLRRFAGLIAALVIGSAHHHPSAALSSRPTSKTAER